jgi:hypothetical protein
LKTLRIVIHCCCFCLLLAAFSAWAADAEDNWQSLVTKYTIICFHSDKDLTKFNDCIDYASGGGLGSLFGGSDGKSLNDELTQKIDKLFVRVQEILDMRKYIRKVRINIYSNKDQLQEAYHHKIENRDTDDRAWYVFDQHTIYVQVGDLNEGMLAHEMAHSIIDNYLQVRPPPATAEILARYVDAHLHD